ncbi:putative phosphoribosyltransferase [Kribbella voronezhensis]|uniref:Putative phosphoribosyltransferase n=1 Tax=Kribbella voronezhensis TaxID=2512212 RepID=A0A4R7SXC6_9ACTN|nr:phosphoribosyltransferase family protein [Kribbella voronezhensis]TDU83117.1 putative phosphoribosyltransferase [Kribbella voronezhensis]
MRFADRVDAGRRLASALRRRVPDDAVVLGLPRGGVPVAAVVAERLDLPLDVLVVRKLGLPGQPELALGAVGEDGVLVMNDALVASSGVSQEALAAVARRERAVVEQRAGRLRLTEAAIDIRERTVVLVDDGVATGSTMQAACQVARARGAAAIVVAVPVGAAAALKRLRSVADEVICLMKPKSFIGVGQWYRDFGQTSEAEVIALLAGTTTQQGDS